jgi:hypothetical protein
MKMVKFSGLSLLLSLGSISAVNAADLVISGVQQTISGEKTYDDVILLNGAKLLVEPFNGTTGGFLKLKAKKVIIDATSAIIADGSGYRGIINSNGEGPGGGLVGSSDGGGGGAYGGLGGNGVTDGGGSVDGIGGKPYGTPDKRHIEFGSAGGASASSDYGDYGGFGGNGGGTISIEAYVIKNAGTISTNGQDGKIYYNDSTGGGAGGGILLSTGVFINSGVVSAKGGSGGTIGCGTDGMCGEDDGGGGGSGGRIKVFYGKQRNTGNISVAGGTGGIYAAAGDNGTVYQKSTFSPDGWDRENHNRDEWDNNCREAWEESEHN